MTFEPRFIEGGVRLTGDRWSPRVHELKDFLTRSRVAVRFIEHDGPTKVQLPDGTTLVDPEVREVAEKLGLEIEPEGRHYDLVIVGGGPAGLSAAICAASEGLRTIVVEQSAPGGQAGYSARIENYAGFPDGLSGSDFTRRTVEQAQHFGAEILVTRHATGLRREGQRHFVALDDDSELEADCVLLAMGVSFKWLDAPGCSNLVGAGIYYGAATAEASACTNQDVHILGCGNSAGQAALLLCQHARRVIIVAVEDALEDMMSQYLVDRIRATKNIEVKNGHTVTSAGGGDHLEWLTIQDVKTGQEERVPSAALFVFIGAEPRTGWLDASIARDEKGFILCGLDYLRDDSLPGWPLKRPPFALESSMPGVFTAGDVRHSSIKRVAAAVGEGAMSVQFIHRYAASKERVEAPRSAARR